MTNVTMMIVTETMELGRAVQKGRCSVVVGAQCGVAIGSKKLFVVATGAKKCLELRVGSDKAAVKAMLGHLLFDLCCSYYHSVDTIYSPEYSIVLFL